MMDHLVEEELKMKLNYNMEPVVSIDELKDAVVGATGYKFQTDFRQLLFDYNNYMNDVYVGYYFDEDEKYLYPSWQNETKIKERNLVNQFLREMLGDEFERIIIDVSW